ncbi:diacylglycerol kinase [Vibrio sp. TRT 21S02]|uniref:diacylglycerol kinase n=1 Tax=unclassified Vibrio TaxID=2614977 RepID=UPI003CEAF9AD
MPVKNIHGLKRLRNAVRYSWLGLKAAFANEPAFREEIVLASLMIPVAFWLDVTQIERILLIGTVFLVLIIELVNSAIEAVVDRVSEEHHELSGRAKDMGSAAVMMSMIVTGYTWFEIIIL